MLSMITIKTTRQGSAFIEALHLPSYSSRAMIDQPVFKFKVHSYADPVKDITMHNICTRCLNFVISFGIILGMLKFA